MATRPNNLRLIIKLYSVKDSGRVEDFIVIGNDLYYEFYNDNDIIEIKKLCCNYWH